MRSRFIVLIALGACAVLAPASASAATLGTSSTSISYNAVAGEANNLTITQSAQTIVFTDAPGVTITAAAPCTAAANVGTCPALSGSLNASAGDMNDRLEVTASVTAPRLVSLLGGAGSDTIIGAPATANSIGGDGGVPAGGDIIVGGSADDGISGGGGNDSISGGAGADSLTGEEGVDAISAGPGPDIITTQTQADGPDVISGGSEIDTYDAASRVASVNVSLDGIANDGDGCPGALCENDDVGADVENVVAGVGADVLSGNAAPNELSGSLGDDTITGGDGADRLDGSSGDDALSGDDGADLLAGGGGTDALAGGPGADRFAPDFADEAPDTLSGGPGTDQLLAPSPESTLDGITVSLRIDLDGRADDGFAASPALPAPADNVMADIENLQGGPGDDVLTGSGAANEIEGGDGADRILGGKGTDGLEGGRGADALTGGKGRDLLEGDGGPDRITSRDRGVDEVFCGAALDTVKADRADRTSGDCDRVKRPRKRRS